MRWFLHGVLVASLLLGACGDDDDGDRAAVTSLPEETTTSTSSTTTEPRTVPPDVIPQDVSQITEAYVEQVLDELYAAMLPATVATREAGLVEESAIQIAEATHTPSGSRALLNSLAQEASDGFQGFQEQLSPVDTTVVEVHEATRMCVFAEVTFDSSGLTTETPNASGFRLFARVVPATEEQRASGLNPTAWVLDELPAISDGPVPTQQCRGS